MQHRKNNLLLALGWLSLGTIILTTGCNNQNQTPDQKEDSTKVNNNVLTYNRDSARRHVMGINEALSYSNRFRDTRKRLAGALEKDPYFKAHPFKLPNGEYFNRDAIIALLNQAQNGGIRVYLGQDSTGTVKLVLVPATAKQDFITTLIPPISSRSANAPQAAPLEGQTMERGQECPSMCPATSPFTN